MAYPTRQTVKLTTTERDQLRAAATAAGQTVTDYVRAAILAHAETPPAPAPCTETVQVRLGDAEEKLVARASERSGVSRSEIVRAAIRAAVTG